MTQSLQNRAAPCVQAQGTQKPSQSVPMAVPSQRGEPKVSSIFNSSFYRKARRFKGKGCHLIGHNLQTLILHSTFPIHL